MIPHKHLPGRERNLHREQRDGSIRFGNSKAFLGSLIVLIIIGVVIGLGTRRWDYWFAISSFAVLAIAAPLALYKAWRNPGTPIYLVSLLPSGWRRWMIGEYDVESKDKNPH